MLNKIFFVIVASFIAISSANAQSLGQVQKSFSIGGRYQATVIIVGGSAYSKEIDKLITLVSEKATDAYSKLDWQNSSSEVSKIAENATKGPVKVSPDVLAAFETAAKISDWTKGAFDITFAGEGTWRDIKVDSNASTVEFTKASMQARFDNMMSGFMAELIGRYIYASGMQNAIIKVGNSFRGFGEGLHGPWKIEIQDDAGTFAKHALNLVVMNTGISAVSASQYRSEAPIDPRKKSAIDKPCRGTVVVMNDAAFAEGVARAAFIMGPEDGIKLISKLGKGLVVDNQSKFLRSPGF